MREGAACSAIVNRLLSLALHDRVGGLALRFPRNKDQSMANSLVRQCGIVAVFLMVAMSMSVLSLESPSASEQPPFIIEGQAKAVSGNTLEIWGHPIRLWGIRVADPDSEKGRKAIQHLQRLVAGVTVTCHAVDATSLRHLVAQCFVGGIDIARPIIEVGYAQDDPAQSDGYYARSN